MALDFITGAEDLAGKVLSFFKTPSDIANAQKALYDFQSKVQEIEASKYLADIELLKSQAVTNTEEAKSANLFVAGWRPFTGWSSSVVFLILSIVLLIAVWNKVDVGGYMYVYSAIGALLMQLLGLRTFEKYHGIANASDNDPAPKAIPVSK